MQSHTTVFSFTFTKGFYALVYTASLIPPAILFLCTIFLFSHSELPFPPRAAGLILGPITALYILWACSLLHKGPLELFDDHLYYKYGLFPKQVLCYKDISYAKPAQQDDKRHRLSEPAHGPVESTVVIGLHNGQERFLSLRDSQVFLQELSSRF